MLLALLYSILRRLLDLLLVRRRSEVGPQANRWSAAGVGVVVRRLVVDVVHSRQTANAD
jgi:hypothetical protein